MTKLAKDRVEVVAIQHETLYGDYEHNARAAFAILHEASTRTSPDIVCFSYYWQVGHSDGMRAPWLEELVQRGKEKLSRGEMTLREMNQSVIRNFAQPIPGGTACQMLSEKAREYSTHIVGGSMPEIDSSTGKLYHSSPIFDPRGRLLGVHRKTLLWDREALYVTPGNDFEVFDTEVGRFGVAICSEGVFVPEICRIYAMKGADVIFNPFGPHWSREVAMGIPLTRAIENQLFFVMVNQLAKGWKYPNIPSYGTCIASPYNHQNPILGIAEPKPSYVSATLDLKRLRSDRAMEVPVSPDYGKNAVIDLIEGKFSYPMLRGHVLESSGTSDMIYRELGDEELRRGYVRRVASDAEKGRLEVDLKQGARERKP